MIMNNPKLHQLIEELEKGIKSVHSPSSLLMSIDEANNILALLKGTEELVGAIKKVVPKEEWKGHCDCGSEIIKSDSGKYLICSKCRKPCYKKTADIDVYLILATITIALESHQKLLDNLPTK